MELKIDTTLPPVRVSDFSYRSEANLPRSEMAAFLVEFYLEQLEPETFDDR